MKALISRSTIRGRVAAPPSKSYTLRALMCSALAKGQSEIIEPLYSDDTNVACRVLRQIGADIRANSHSWMVTGGKFHQPVDELFCGESAGTLRFMAAICSLVPGKCRLTAAPSLQKRPLKPLVNALQQMGIKCSLTDGTTPLTIEGKQIEGGVVVLPGDVSSQYITALLLIAPYCKDGLTIRLTNRLESKPYIYMTLDCMKTFGIEVEHSSDLSTFTVKPQTYRPAIYRVEGDWSSASYLLALGAVAGEIEVSNLAFRSKQADKDIWILLNRMGTDISISHDTVKVRQSKLKAFRADLADCIDLLPTVAVMAALADGCSEISGIRRARIKESDRIAAVKLGMQRMGIKIEEENDRIFIEGTVPHGTIIDSMRDHRIAMAFSILGIVAGDTIIEGAECVSKTYPQFWDVLKNIGGKVMLDG